jgi:hypothetical protein
MKMSGLIVGFVFFTILSISSLAYSNGQSKIDESAIKTGKREKVTKNTDMDRIIDALTLIVIYKEYEDDRKALREALEQRYRMRKDEDPFAFKSRMLRRLLIIRHLDKEGFKRRIKILNDAMEELNRHYYEREDN